MKKIVAILLLMLLLFNLYGYRAWFYYLQQQSQQQLAAVIDENTYSDSELITIKVPLSLPYFNSWNDFEKYDGNIEVDGQHYSYVKRKVQNDTLVLLCLPNKEQNKLTSAQKRFESFLNGSINTATGNKASNPLLLLKLLPGEYCNNISLYLLKPPVIAISVYSMQHTIFYPHYSIASPWQPPDFIC